MRARMVDPFEKGKGNRLITSRYNGKHLLIPSIPEKLLQDLCICDFNGDVRNTIARLAKKADPQVISRLKQVWQSAAPLYSNNHRMLVVSEAAALEAAVDRRLVMGRLLGRRRRFR